MTLIPCAVCGSNKHELLTVACGNRGLDYVAREHNVVICSDCGLVYLNPQQPEEVYARYYQTADYEPITASAETILNRHGYRRIQAAFLIDTLNELRVDAAPEQLSVLDIGCGPGILLHYLAQAGFSASGLETNPHAADYASKTFGLSIKRDSIFGDRLPEATYDVVTSTASIEHFTDPFDALLRMKAALKPGGLLYVNTPDLLGMVLKKGEKHWFKFVHTYYFTEKSLCNLLEKAGLDIIRSWTMPPQLEASIIAPGNYCSGELNVVACKRNRAVDSAPALRKETAAEIIAAYASAHRRDRIHAFTRRWATVPPLRLAQRALTKVFPAREVFRSFYRPDGTIETKVFPPMVATGAAAGRAGA